MNEYDERKRLITSEVYEVDEESEDDGDEGDEVG
jgi:hypothetical protein